MQYKYKTNQYTYKTAGDVKTVWESLKSPVDSVIWQSEPGSALLKTSCFSSLLTRKPKFTENVANNFQKKDTSCFIGKYEHW